MIYLLYEKYHSSSSSNMRIFFTKEAKSGCGIVAKAVVQKLVGEICFLSETSSYFF